MLQNRFYYKDALIKSFIESDLQSIIVLLINLNDYIKYEKEVVQDEIATEIANIINEYSKSLKIQTDPKFKILGFSGGGNKSLPMYNISTISCIIASLLYDDVKIIKSGSKKNTSSCGSFDFLNYLGIKTQNHSINESLSKFNIGFVETIDLYRFLPIFFIQNNKLCKNISKRTIFNEVDYNYKIIGLNNNNYEDCLQKYKNTNIEKICLISSFDNDKKIIIDELLYGLENIIVTSNKLDNCTKCCPSLSLGKSYGFSLQSYKLVNDNLEDRKLFLDNIINKKLYLEDICLTTILLNIALILNIYNGKTLKENFSLVKGKYINDNCIKSKRKDLILFHKKKLSKLIYTEK